MSAMQTLKWFQNNAVTLPSRPYREHGKVLWSVPDRSRILFILHNPRYAECFVYGRSQTRKLPRGRTRFFYLPMDDWQVCIPEAHAGYIHPDKYCRNQETLEPNRCGFVRGAARQPPPRHGVALLHSRVICGHRVLRMAIQYTAARTSRGDAARSYYHCKYNIVRTGVCTCQSLRGEAVDVAAVSGFIMAAVNRENIALALAVREQVRADLAAVDRQYANRIEALCTQADMARRRYLAVDPSNRLVAAPLEAEWNTRLETLTRAIGERERLGKAHQRAISAEPDERIMELACDFVRVWNTPAISHVDRERLLAPLVDDATVTREGYRASICLRLRAGKTHTLSVELPRPRYMTMQRMCGKPRWSIPVTPASSASTPSRSCLATSVPGTKKSRGEASIGDVEKNFLAGLDISDFRALTPAVRHRIVTVVNVRIHGKTRKRPVELFALERDQLPPMGGTAHDIGAMLSEEGELERVEVGTGRTACHRGDLRAGRRASGWAEGVRARAGRCVGSGAALTAREAYGCGLRGDW